MFALKSPCRGWVVGVCLSVLVLMGLPLKMALARELPPQTSVIAVPVLEKNADGAPIEQHSTIDTARDNAPVHVPSSVRLLLNVRGEVKKFSYTANAELLWQKVGNRYEASQQIRAFLLGTRTQSSTGSITSKGLQPERFSDKRRNEQSAYFDFDKREVSFSADVPNASLDEGAQDRLSVFIQLAAMLAAAPERYPTGTRITLTVVGTSHADRWGFTVQGTETLMLPVGPTPAVKLQRLPRPGRDRDRGQRAELWLGSEMGYLPVRIRITQDNGDFVDLLLSGQEAL